MIVVMLAASPQSIALTFKLTQIFNPELNSFDPRARPGQKNERAHQAYARTREQNRTLSKSNVNFVPLRAHASTGGRDTEIDKDASFGQRRSSITHKGKSKAPSHAGFGPEGGVEMSWVPSSTAGAGDDEDISVAGGLDKVKKKNRDKRKNVESFGAGMERGGGTSERYGATDAERRGRMERRKGVRSGSKNAFRRV